MPCAVVYQLFPVGFWPKGTTMGLAIAAGCAPDGSDSMVTLTAVVSLYARLMAAMRAAPSPEVSDFREQPAPNTDTARAAAPIINVRCRLPMVASLNPFLEFIERSFACCLFKHCIGHAPLVTGWLRSLFPPQGRLIRSRR